jgi:2-dehydro-3-deoxyphosphogluconate aldolase/(4S)-4-hydroxy-2-oxoglutarate aldolase
MSLIEGLEKARIIPIIVLDDAEDIIPVCKALQDGGLTVAEVTFRTDAAEEAIRMARDKFTDFIIGAGTITTIDEVECCKSAGAQFAVAPGLNPEVVKRAQDLELPFFPGICTPTDVETALGLGCTILKFFPASAMGGTKMLKALYGPYRHRGVRFIPTGGINGENLHQYLDLQGVIAVGGSWLVKRDLIKKKNWDEITTLTREALQ